MGMTLTIVIQALVFWAQAEEKLQTTNIDDVIEAISSMYIGMPESDAVNIMLKYEGCEGRDVDPVISHSIGTGTGWTTVMNIPGSNIYKLWLLCKSSGGVDRYRQHGIVDRIYINKNGSNIVEIIPSRR